MNKKEFMQKLKDGLIGLNQTDKREVLLDYEEHFMDGKNLGRTEEEICESLGDPAEISREIKNQSQKGMPNNDGVNMAGYIIGILFLAVACVVLGAILFSMLTGAISGVIGIVAVMAIIPNTMLVITAVSAIVFAISIFSLIAMGIIKLIPIIVKWFKQMYYSLDNRSEEAKALKHKKVKIHAIVWILVSLLAIASIGGMIFGSIGFAKYVVSNVDAEDIHEFREKVQDWTESHRGGYIYYNGNVDEFEDIMDDFEDDMDEFADDMEETFGDGNWFFAWRYIFGD
ncbi:MAG: DUF1700 domain-containing protein [Eubacteriales bacterium]